MPPSPEINARIRRHEEQLEIQTKWARRRAIRAHWIALLLMALMVTCSTVAGVSGLARLLPSEAVGVLAIIPAAIAIIATAFKFQERSSWNYRRVAELEQLQSRLTLQLPETPSADNVAAIARDRDSAQIRAQKDYEDRFSLNFSSFLPKGSKSADRSADKEPPAPR